MAVDGEYELAGTYLETAAKNSYLPAQWDYAMYLKSMSPVEFQDHTKAYAWLSVVRTRDSEQNAFAKEHMEDLEKSLSSAELATAKEMARRYISTYAE